jgi:hypothetical protein
VDFGLDRYSINRSVLMTLCLAPFLLIADVLMRGIGLDAGYVALSDLALFVALAATNMILWKPFTHEDVEVIGKALPSSFSKVRSFLRHCAKQAKT